LETSILVDFSFLFTSPAVDVTAGVSGFEGREVLFEVIWPLALQYPNTAWVISPEVTQAPHIVSPITAFAVGCRLNCYSF
jgi:hypothetical protein